MPVIDLVFAFIVALLLSLLFVPLVGPRDRGMTAGTIAFFFLIFFLASWAGGMWLTPVGPSLWGGYWLPFLLMGVFVALLLAAVSEPSRRRTIRSTPEQEDAAAVATATAFGLMFWILILALVAVIATAYVVR